jgi:serine/threonine protein kinase
MEYMIGGELFTHLKLSGKLSNDKAKFYAAELVLFLQYLEEHNLLYR